MVWVLEYSNVGIMNAVDYNGEKLKGRKLVVKNWVCSPMGVGDVLLRVLFIDSLQLSDLLGIGSSAASYLSQGQAPCRGNSHPVTALCRPVMA